MASPPAGGDPRPSFHGNDPARPSGPDYIALTPMAHPAAPDAHHNASGSAAAAGTNNATSTAFEPVTPPPGGRDAHDPIARHAAGRYSSASASVSDVERQTPPAYSRETDPYNLRGCLKSPGDMQTIRANVGCKRARGGGTGDALCGSSTAALVTREGRRARKLEAFYERQNENIERLLKPVDEHVREAKHEEGEDNLRVKIAVRGSFAANVVLAVLQLYGAASSGSLSLFTTMADAVFDPLSNLTLVLCSRAVNRVDPRKFPSGKARIETAGNIVFCFLMTAVSFIIIVMACRELAAGIPDNPRGLHIPSVVAVCAAFATKAVLFLYCWALRNKYSQVRILWEDHRNDLLINGFGILTSVGGAKLHWWIDPAGAIAISTLVATLWLTTAYREFQLLIGVAADTDMLQLITYISMTHDAGAVRAIDTVRAWHSGPRLIVEVDIVMDPEASLRATHDVAEALQTKLESLPDVERCYVHVDYETSHAPEHFWKKEL